MNLRVVAIFLVLDGDMNGFPNGALKSALYVKPVLCSSGLHPAARCGWRSEQLSDWDYVSYHLFIAWWYVGFEPPLAVRTHRLDVDYHAHFRS